MLKPVKISQIVSTVSPFDPAIDVDKSEKGDDGGLAFGVDRLTDPSCWKDKLSFYDGQYPTVFYIGVIPSHIMNMIEDECLDPDNVSRRGLSWKSFINGIHDISHADFGDIDKVSINGVEYVDPKWLTKTFVGPLRRVALDIGSLVFAWNSFTGEDEKNLHGPSK